MAACVWVQQGGVSSGGGCVRGWRVQVAACVWVQQGVVGSGGSMRVGASGGGGFR